MSMFKYLFSTSWNQKKADWKEYNQLKQKLVQTEKEKDSAIMAISSFYTSDAWAKRKSCCCINYVEDPILEIKPEFDRLYCRNFGPRVCKDETCHMKNSNNNYVNLSNEYFRIENLLDSFWNNKFRNAR